MGRMTDERLSEIKRTKYLMEFELRPGYEHLENSDEYFPVMICRLNEVYEVMQEYYSMLEDGECPDIITNIRPATEEEIAKYPHYYD